MPGVKQYFIGWSVGLSMTALLAFQGKPVSFNRLPSGLEYRIYRLDKGRYVRRAAFPATGDATYASRVGKVMAMHMQFRTGKDSLLMSSRRQMQGQLARVPLDTLRPFQRGGIEEALSLLQPGDSGVFRFAADTIFSKSFHQPVPPFIRKAGNTLTVLVKAAKIQTQEAAMQDSQQEMLQAQEREKKLAAAMIPKEDALIEAYLKEKSLTGNKAPGGVYYVITKAGTGPKPAAGQTVSVLYTGMLLNGKVFDSSEKNGGRPISFALGRGQVIPGWDEGIGLLNEGSEAILLIPSRLAYGSRGAGADIPANSILRFNVSLVGVKASPGE